MSFPPPAFPPAGWYPNPQVPGTSAYWDGRQWHLAPASRQPHDTLPLAAAVVALVAVLVPLVLSRLITAWLADRDLPVPLLVAVAAVVGYGPAMVCCWWAARRWGNGSVLDTLGLRARWSDLGWGPVTYLCCLLGQVAAGMLVALLRIPVESNIGETDDLDRSYVIAILVLAVIAAPICEEIIFRGVVLRGFLSVMPAVAAVGLQGVVFGVVHFDPALGVGNVGLVIILSTVGCVLGGAAYLFRRIVPSMIAHAILNTVALTLALTGVLDRLAT